MKACGNLFQIKTQNINMEQTRVKQIHLANVHLHVLLGLTWGWVITSLVCIYLVVASCS